MKKYTRVSLDFELTSNVPKRVINRVVFVFWSDDKVEIKNADKAINIDEKLIIVSLL